jgi:hypothetical protein
VNGELSRRVLGLRAVVEVEPPGLAEQLAAFLPDVEHERPETARARYRISRRGDGYLLGGDDGPDEVELHLGGLVRALGARIDGRALRDADPDLVLTAAIGLAGERRVLLVNEEREASTLLAHRLLHDGIAMEGAGFVALADGQATALAAPFIFARDPGGHAEGAVQIHIGDGRWWSLRPDRSGFPWRISTGAVHVVVEVRWEDGPGARVVELARWEMARAVGACALPGSERSRHPAALARLVDGAACWRLAAGSLEEASGALRAAFEHLSGDSVPIGPSLG